jgi:hypothetical protein
MSGAPRVSGPGQDLDEVDAGKQVSLSALRQIDPPGSGGPVIAVDLDDVLSLTNQAVADCKQRQIDVWKP